MAVYLNNQSPTNKVEEIKIEEPTVKEAKWPTNAKWIISLLVLAVICFLVFILENLVMQGDSLLSALTNFSTILSIFLSVSSIAFAGYTSIETGRQFHYMSRAVEEIRTSNRIMSENYKNLLNHYHDTVNTFSKIFEQKNHTSNTTNTTGASKVNVEKISNAPSA